MGLLDNSGGFGGGLTSMSDGDQMMLGLAQGLLSARGGAGFAAGLGNMQGVQDSLLKRQLTRAQLQEMGVKTQMDQMTLQRNQAFMDAVKQANSQQPMQPAQPSQPAIPPQDGGGLGSGTFGMSVGGQTASAPPQQTQGGPSGGALSFRGMPNSISNMAALTMPPGDFMKALIAHNAPQTDIEKLMVAQGIPPGSPQWAQGMQQAQQKALYTAPANIRPGGYTQDINGKVRQFPVASPGYTMVDNGQGGFNEVKVNGGLEALQGSAEAKTAGEGRALPYAGVSATGAPLPVVSRTQAATQGQVPPYDSNATPQSRAASDVASLQKEIAAVPKMFASAAQKQERLTVLNAEMAKAQSGAQAAPAPAAAPSAIYAAPPMGAVTNADAAQKASAQTMHDSYSKLQSGGATANGALDALEKMQALAAKKDPFWTGGVLGTNQSAVNPDAAEYEKQRANLITLLAQQGGTNGTDAGRALTGDSVPDFGKPKAAIADGLGTLRNQVIAQTQLKRDVLTPAFQSGDSKKYTTLEAEYDKNIAPSMVPILTLAGPAQKSAVASAIEKNPSLRSKFEWAFNNGLLK